MIIESVKVGIAELKTAFAPVSIITTGLGSCVGICLWDPIIKVGGMVHIMLPDSTQVKTVHNKAKYADSGIAMLIEQMSKLGANPHRLVAKIAGGSQMFNFPGSSNLIRIGERNVQTVKSILEASKIKILAEDTGGNYGRTIEFYTNNGHLLVKTIHKGVKVI